MNAILSIKPEFVAEIAAGRKGFEFRKTIFKQRVEKVYIYASSPVSRIVGEFEPVDVVKGTPEEVWKQTKTRAGISRELFDAYYKGHETAYAIVIRNYVEYKEPKRLPKGVTAPQSYCYVPGEGS